MIRILAYDEAALIRKLAQVAVRSRVAFASACAVRLIPGYEEFCRRASRRDGAALAEILERIWGHLLGSEMSRERIEADLSRCLALLPSEVDDSLIGEQPYAEDAASAVAYAARALATGDPQEAAWAARRAYEAADHHVMHRLGVQDDGLVLRHPIVQSELARQHRDIEDLMGAKSETPELFVRIRDRAWADAPKFFVASS